MSMNREFAISTTVATVSAIWAVDRMLDSSEGPAFVSVSRQQQQPPRSAAWAPAGTPVQPAAQPALGNSGLLAYGVGCGALAAVACGGRGRRTRRAAADIEVAEKTETKPVSYLENIPRTIVEKKTLDKLLSTLPKEQWENPPEDSYLYTLKAYAETYGPGKATKMGWYDFWYMRINAVDEDEFYSGEEMEAQKAAFREVLEGKIPLLVPGPAGLFWTGATIQWRGPEMFSGDQMQTPVNSGLFAKQYTDNLAFYREGLKPWQRGLEIGMAHGYFLIGPFVSLGPLRNTPEAATVGLLCGCAVVGIVSVGGLIFGSTIKPKFFDKEGDADGAGFIELINWHAVGGIGGAGFAHALLTVFGS